MIWPEVWLYALAVVYRRMLNRRWVTRMSSKGSRDDVHRTGGLHSWGAFVYDTCACPECVSEFDFAFRLVRLP